MRKHVIVAICLWLRMAAPLHAEPTASLTLVPPSPVTDEIAVDIRGAVWNRSEQIAKKNYSIVVHGKPTHEETRATFSHAAASTLKPIAADTSKTWICA